jgi:transposase
VPITSSHNPKIEVLSGSERRRRWSTAEKLAIVQETYEPDVTVSIVARRHGIQPNQLFNWRWIIERQKTVHGIFRN